MVPDIGREETLIPFKAVDTGVMGMEGNKLYVGNLNYAVTNDQLKELFSSYGDVKQVNIIEHKGFGFVEMGDPAEAERAKEALNGSEFMGRTLRIDEARPPRERTEFRRY
jgi:RNA recognition motif-containing protein